MVERDGYGQFCPVSMASEILCSRWTTLVVREFLCGSTRFNELRRGLPKMSPALLSKRLKELEQSGVITVTRSANGITDYQLTAAGEELRPLIIGLGNWAQRWMESRLSLKNLDPSLLMRAAASALARALANCCASRAAWATTRRDSTLFGRCPSSRSARFSRSSVESPLRALT